MRPAPSMALSLLRRIPSSSRWRHHAYRTAVKLVPVSRRHMDEWLQSTRCFFAMSTGRTGTTWLANLLASGTPESVQVVHEPVPGEAWAYREADEDKTAAGRYIHGFRVKETYLRTLARPVAPEVYGEVNGKLLGHIPELREAFPGATFLHITRDGREVVRSVMPRLHNVSNTRVFADHVPTGDDEWAQQWEQLDDFTRACWSWQHFNGILRRHIQHRARFEDIVANHEEFSKQVLGPLQLEVSKATWARAARTPVKATRKHAIGPWEDWSDEQQSTFARICGDEMNRLGYRF